MSANVRGAVVALCLVLGLSAHAQRRPRSANDAGMLYLRDYAFDPVKAPLKLAPSLRATAESGWALVQYEPARGQAVYDALRAAKVVVIAPVARYGLLVGNARLKQVRAIKGVRYAEPFQPAYKLSPHLRRAADSRRDGPIGIVIDVFRDAPGVAKAVGAFGKAFVVGSQRDRVVARIPARALASVAAIADVRGIEPSMRPTDRLDVAPMRMGVRTQSAPPNFENLDGTGQQLGVYDSGCDNGVTGTLIPDLVGRVSGDTANWINNVITVPTWADINYAGGIKNHGTSVIDLAIGNGARSGQLLTGIAYAATARVRPFNADTQNMTPDYLNVPRALQNSYAWGARVHNDSWDPATGTWPDLDPIDNEYLQQTSAEFDRFTYMNTDLVVVVAVGNDGDQGIGANACSKNPISAGASGNGAPPTGAVNPDSGIAYDADPPDVVPTWSSEGPAPDGRLKPEVVAPSAANATACTQAMMDGGTCPEPPVDPPYAGQPAYYYAGATSYAAPLISGMALLLRQFLIAQGHLTPSGMLVKGMIINGAFQVTTTPTPDNKQGWGLVNLPRAIDGWGNGHGAGGDTYFYDSMNTGGLSFRFTQTGQSVVFRNVVFAQGVPLAITMDWYDPPSGGATGDLINDLDVTLTLQNGTVYHGGVNSMAGGYSQPGQAADTTNNTLKLMLAQTPAQPATITVTATRIVPQNPQPFAIVVTSVQSQGASTEKPAKGVTLASLRSLRKKPKPPARR